MSNDTNDAMVHKLCQSRFALSFLISRPVSAELITGQAAYDLSKGPTEPKKNYTHVYSTQK